MNNKILFAALFSFNLSSAAIADPIDVGGVVWDPEAGAPFADFSMDYSSYQWFTNNADAISNTPNAIPVLNTINPGGLIVGDVLGGVAEVFRMNGNTADVNSLTGGALCPNCELTLTFGGFEITSFDTNSPIFSGGWINFYVDHTPDFTPTDAGGINPANAANGDLWLALDVTGNTFFGSSPESGDFTLDFQAVGGLAQANFDTNTKQGLNGLVDLISNNSTIFNNFQDLNFSGQGSTADQFKDYYASENGQIFGSSVAVPEPNTLALAGLALLVVAGLRRRRLR